MDEAIIWVSIISGVFGLIGLELMSHNWFKKKRFEFEVYNLKKQQDLQLKKMAKELGLSSSPQTNKNSLTAGDGVGSLLDMAKSLSPDQLGVIADVIQGRLGGGEGEGSPMPEGLDGLVDFAVKNPDIIKGFMDGMKQGKGGEAAAGGDLL